MNESRRLASVAVSGPLRRSFTYHLPPDINRLEPGQRVLVEFGRSRVVGFYLGEPESAPDVRTKPIIRALDPVSHFPRDLFDLCLWMSDYYFANPADCLACGLPSVLKTRRTATLTWAAELPEETNPKARPFFRPGKKLSEAHLQTIRGIDRSLLSELVRQGGVVEEWGTGKMAAKRVVRGYTAADPEAWSKFFQRRRFQPELVDGETEREALRAKGWTEHYLRAALQAGLLKPIFAEPGDDILSFVKPKEGVTELEPNVGQQKAFHRLVADADGFGVTLLHGVTGSGKTLVYCHLARRVLERDRTVLVLTPEIALSGATLSYFRGFFGDIVTVIHSAMTERERLESWRGIRRGRYKIVVGPRSALFAPLDKLGLIIVDEEHDGSYKQVDPSPRFHGRDAAIMRAKLNDIPILLGSASPSVESYHHARTGRYRLLQLDERPAGAELPSVTIVDMRTQRLQGDTPYLSFMLKKAIDARLDADQQAILFLNRRGYSPQLKCVDCGHVPACPQCEIKLTYHKTGNRLSCHYCGHVIFGYHVCEKCSGKDFLYPGAGTQKVEEHVARLFARGKVLRFDSDTASGRKNAHQLLHEFAGREYNLLLGTQMVTKGLDLPGVTLVGVISADMGLDLPDFRANEKTFARLLQVAGRAGRGEKAGDVYIQTYYPESGVIQDAAEQNYVRFFDREIASRRDHRFPPFARLIRFVLASKDKAQTEEVAARFALELKERAARRQIGMDLLGPAACPMALLRGWSRRHLIVRTNTTLQLGRMLIEWESGKARFGLPATVKITVDVDPDDMM